MLKTTQKDTLSIHTTPRALQEADAPTLLSLYTELQKEFYGILSDQEEYGILIAQLEDSFLFYERLSRELQTALEVLSCRNRALQVRKDAEARTFEACREFRILTGDRTPNDFIDLPNHKAVDEAQS